MGHLGAHGAIHRLACLAALGAGCLVLANCSGGPGRIDPRYGVSRQRAGGSHRRARAQGRRRLSRPASPIPSPAAPTCPKIDARDYHEVGYASWYGDDFHGRYTANGEIFDEQSISAASPVLPLPSYVRVTNLSNHRSIVVRVNDRGPFAKDRILDVSRKTAKLLGFHDRGITKVQVDYVGRAPLARLQRSRTGGHACASMAPGEARSGQGRLQRAFHADLFRFPPAARRAAARPALWREFGA